MNRTSIATYVNKTIEDLRYWRDMEENQEIRSEYNKACDRLDVLLSKLIHDNGSKEKAS